MAPKKRFQRPSGDADQTLSTATDPINLFTPTNDRRRRPRESPRTITSSRLPLDPSQGSLPLSLSPIVSQSPLSPTEGPSHIDGSRSRRDSTSTMRTSSISLDGPTTCTPTGRISKAKKGKRVHACEFPGCGKVFTRAEHRRRHELNHNPEALFPCTRPGCRKSFHRVDLLQRHQERHDLESAADGSAGHLGHLGQMPPTSEPSAPLSGPMGSPAGSQNAPRSSSGGLSIGSLVHPQSYSMATPAFTGYPRHSTMHYIPGFTSSDDSMFYTPESSQSPVSEYYGRYPHRQSISSSSSVAAFDPNAGSPLISGTIPGPWIPTSGPPSMMPSNMLDAGSYITPPADTSLPIVLSDLDGYEWSVIRRELSNTSGLLSGDPTTGISDTIRWDCLEHYWQHFHTSFPIIHRPTFLPAKPSPLLASAMAAIGSQYDTRPDAKLYSLKLLEIATKLLRRRDSITSRSRLADLQTVFLLEILSKYCARRVEIEMSSRFRSLFASLDQARRTLATDPLAVFRTLRKDRTPDDIARAHKFWLEHETRRRILQASTILDSQQSTLFEQPATIVHHDRPRRPSSGLRCNVQLPCSEELWEASPIERWVDVATSCGSPKSRSARMNQSPSALDFFQAQVYLTSNDNIPLDLFLPRMDSTGEASARLGLQIHVREMARNTPIRQLLAVSGESWIVGKKLDNEAEFQDAKRNLRVWVDSNLESRVAFWHATQLIRNHTFITSETSFGELQVSFLDTHMLHEAWVFYLAALICWAYGLVASTQIDAVGHVSGAASTISDPASNHSRGSSLSSVHPALLDPQEAAISLRDFLHSTDADTADGLLHLDQAAFGRTHGLLEIVRLQKVGPLLGGLTNDAERILYRLVEGRSRLSHF